MTMVFVHYSVKHKLYLQNATNQFHQKNLHKFGKNRHVKNSSGNRTKENKVSGTFYINYYNKSQTEFEGEYTSIPISDQTLSNGLSQRDKALKHSTGKNNLNLEAKLSNSRKGEHYGYLETNKKNNPSKNFSDLFKTEIHEKYFKLVQKDAKAANLSVKTFLQHAGKLNIPEDSVDYIQRKINKKSNTTNIPDDLAVNSTLHSTLDINITKPTDIIVINKAWQKQDGQLSIFLYTAFYDDRPALKSPHIRVISVAETSIEHIVCLLWQPGKSSPDVAKATKIEIGPKISPTLQKQYESYLFSCEISREVRPEYVSIVTVLQPKATNLIKITYPERPPPSKVIEFGHCMSIIYWHHEPARIVEWIELHKIWGIGEFNVYINNLDSQIKDIFKNYAQGDLLNIYDLPSAVDDRDKNNEWVILLNMSPAINDCLYRNMYRYRYIVCTDTDEMIVPTIHGNYPAMLSAINTEQAIHHAHPSYMFRNVYFFTDLKPVFKYPRILHTQRYLRHIKMSTFGYSAKSITDPQVCIGLQNHLCWKRAQKYDDRRWLVDVKPEFGMNFHYKKCHFDEFLEKPGECDRMMANYTEDHTMRQFNRELYPKVKYVLQKLHML